MAMNKTSANRPADKSLSQRLWDRVVSPSTSITDIGDQRSARLAASFLLIISLLNIIGGIARIPRLGFSAAFGGNLGLSIIISITAYLIARTKWYRAAIFLFAVSFSSTAYTSIIEQGNQAEFAALIFVYVPISLIVASSFISPWAVFLLTGLNIAGIVITRYFGVTPPSNIGAIAGITTTIGVVLIALSNFRNTVEKDRLKEVQNINRELEDLTANLEQRVNERTNQLEKANQQTSRRASQLQTITQLSETIAQVDDLNQLFPATTELISQQFGFYHVGIFLVDENKEFTVLQAANSEGGKRMLSRAHKLKLGTGVVGFSARTGQPRIALDVGADAAYFDNPDLPDTHSEAAIPMKSRGEVIGVLDVQSTEVGAFTTEDLQVLTTLANQVSIAFENLRLLNETRGALKQVQEVYSEYTRAEWSRTVSGYKQPGFRYQAGRIEMLEEELQLPEVLSAVRKGQSVANQANGSNEKRPSMAVPVKFQDEVIGVLHIEASDSSKEWQDDDISLVEAVAERVAYAMENARLFQDARRRAAKEQLISQASSRISSALDFENILRSTAEELERALGGSEILIKFENKEVKG